MKKLNPFSWSRKTILFALLIFYAVFIPIYLYIGLQPASASNFSGNLKIPSVNISAGIEDVEMIENKLETPDFSIGSFAPNKNKIFLFAHSSSAFKNLENIKLEDEILYNSETFLVTGISTLLVEKIDMRTVLKSAPEKTLILMTCAGEEKDGNFPARLLVTAVLK